MNILTVSPSPHRRSPMTTQKIMLCVIISLMPALVMSGVIFGLRALMLISVCISGSILFEGVCRIIMKREQTISDLSAAVTGILLAFNLPVTLPLWMALVGCFVAIVIVKQLFGGLGQNFANPAIVARIVLMVSFTADMTKWAVPQYWNEGGSEIVTGATPLVTNDASWMDLLTGFTGGCLGETCAIALIAGGLFLIVMRIISPVTPIAFIGTAAVLSFIWGISNGDMSFALEHTGYQVLSGGLLLGAFFMATDYVTTPITAKGKLIFGIGCGLITFLIRQFGSYPEGVSFSILLMNIVTPYIDRFTMKKPVGGLKEEKAK